MWRKPNSACEDSGSETTWALRFFEGKTMCLLNAGNNNNFFHFSLCTFQHRLSLGIIIKSLLCYKWLSTGQQAGRGTRSHSDVLAEQNPVPGHNLCIFIRTGKGRCTAELKVVAQISIWASLWNMGRGLKKAIWRESKISTTDMNTTCCSSLDDPFEEVQSSSNLRILSGVLPWALSVCLPAATECGSSNTLLQLWIQAKLISLMHAKLFAHTNWE